MKPLPLPSFTSRINFWFYAFLLASTAFVACQIEEPEPEPQLPKEDGLYILNEGNFLRGNATVSFIDFETDEIKHDLYKLANQEALGDVGQSMSLFNNELFIVINNSAKIVVVDPNNMKKKAEINGFTSPRYMLALDNESALVSDLYAKKLWHLDLKNKAIKGSIPVAAWIEKMTLVGNTVFASNAEFQHIYVFDANSLLMTDSIDIGGKSEEIFTDRNGDVWAMRLSDKDKNIKAGWLQIDAKSQKILKIIETEIGETAYAASVTYSATENKAWYILQGTVSELDCEVGTISASVIEQQGSTFYNILFHNNKLWITDAKDFNQKGSIYRYSNSYQLEKTFVGGMIPGDMLLLNE